MVVLEEGSMLTTGHNQYLQPDYLSPLPTTLDAKKSPLALLAQTCSQIGADSPSKPLISSLDKPHKGTSALNARSPPAAKLERTRGSPSDGGSHPKTSSSSNLAFKPYETNVVSTKRSSSELDSSRPASKASVHSASGNAESSVSASSDSAPESKRSRKSPVDGRRSGSPQVTQSISATTTTVSGRRSGSPLAAATKRHSNSSSPSASAGRKTPADRDKSSASPRNSGASPIIRSGMEILSGHKDAAAAAAAASSLQSMYKSAAFGPNGLCCPPGLEANPAFRPPYAGATPFSHHHAVAAALLGYPGAGSPAAGANPYLSYARVKTPSGGETLVPVCKDPYCTGCQYSMHNAQMMMAAAAAATCPSGCTQCDHQKYMMPLSMPPPTSLAGYPGPSPMAAAAVAAAGARPHLCSWVAGDSYCGKRFATSEELLQHLRSHTNLATGTGVPTSGADQAALLAASGQHAHPLLSPSAAAAALHPSLSPLSAARYHPYGKPPTGPMPASLPASPYSAFNALGPYYSPYALYGQRIGAAVHP